MPTRREFLATSLTLTAAESTARANTVRDDATGVESAPIRSRLFPHRGMFSRLAGGDPLAEIHLLAEHGFGGCADHRLASRAPATQIRLSDELRGRGLAWGPFVATENYSDATFASGRTDFARRVLADVDRAVETALRTGARWCIVVPGRADAQLPPARQSQRAVELLRRCIDRCAPAGLTLLLEPLASSKGQRMFVSSIDDAAKLCDAVASDHCQLLFDVYEIAAAGTSLEAAIRHYAPHIGFVQLADFPGRKEPGTGAIDFSRLLQALTSSGYVGPFGLDHGASRPGKRGEQAILDCYASDALFL